MLAKLTRWFSGGEIDPSYGADPYEASAAQGMKAHLRQMWLVSAFLSIMAISTGQWWGADRYWAAFIIVYTFLFLILTKIDEPAAYIWHACVHVYLVMHNLLGQLAPKDILARILWLGIIALQVYSFFALCRAFKYHKELYYAKRYVTMEWLLPRRLQWGWLIGIATTLVAIGLAALACVEAAAQFSATITGLAIYFSGIAPAFAISSLKTPDGPRVWGWIASIFCALFPVALYGLMLFILLSG